MSSILNCGCYWLQAEAAGSHPCTCRTSMIFKTLRLSEFSGSWLFTYLPYMSISLLMATAGYREVISHSAGANVTSMVNFWMHPFKWKDTAEMSIAGSSGAYRTGMMQQAQKLHNRKPLQKLLCDLQWAIDFQISFKVQSRETELF